MLKLSGIIVCLKATGICHFDLAVALPDAGVLLMVINPRASHNFAKVLLKNSKADTVDADTLSEDAASRQTLLLGLAVATRSSPCAVLRVA